ncbi:helix-turn-helix domain-containing protein [Planctomycetales bacterium ZRK34]|nr:helix-turn-helix domain-containing protein [Planctomycetales bacterium ZRK34]
MTTADTTIAPLLVTAEEAARLCGVSRATWFKMRAADRVPAPVHLGGSVRWRTDDLRRWVAAGCPSREAFD